MINVLCKKHVKNIKQNDFSDFDDVRVNNLRHNHKCKSKDKISLSSLYDEQGTCLNHQDSIIKIT